MRCTKTISITVLRCYDFDRLSIVISYQIMLSNVIPRMNDIRMINFKYVTGPSKLIAMQPL